ncbi:MAG: hypothetical protein M1822_000624 [Bathelium mastoideum]|nr:MAG: hypothetical protein M1822_000624 [Bathelium mastoideum]
MTGSKLLDQEYLTLMQNHPYGTAVYKPIYQRRVSTLAALDILIRSIDLQESISLTALAGVPLVGVGSCFRFETSTSNASVLLVNGAVSHRRYYHEAPFKDWVAANAKRILEERPEVREYGLWVVTSTWSAAEAAINCWSGRQKGVDVGFNVNVVEIGELAPKGSWYHAGGSDGWIRVKGDEESGEKVLFFGGLRFHWRRIIGGLKHEKQPKQLRGDVDRVEEESISTFITSGEDGRYELTCEGVLESEFLRPMPSLHTQESNDEEDDEDW